MLITISDRYGCGAVSIAKRAAELLGYECVDEQLPVVVARRLNTSPQAVESAEEVGSSVSERMLRALESGTPEIRTGPQPSFDEDCLREVQEAVREFAAAGNAVIVGRGAHAILGRRPDVLRAFLYAPSDWRLHRVMEIRGLDKRTAAAEIERIDRARASYMRAHYGLDWGNPENYDLLVDTSSYGLDRSAQLIASAVRLQ